VTISSLHLCAHPRRPPFVPSFCPLWAFVVRLHPRPVCSRKTPGDTYLRILRSILAPFLPIRSILNAKNRSLPKLIFFLVVVGGGVFWGWGGWGGGVGGVVWGGAGVGVGGSGFCGGFFGYTPPLAKPNCPLQVGSLAGALLIRQNSHIRYPRPCFSR